LERRCGGSGALRRCGADREDGRQAPAVGLGPGSQEECRAQQSRAHTTQLSCGTDRGWAPRARPGRHRLERRYGSGGGALRRCGAAREQGREPLAVGLGRGGQVECRARQSKIANMIAYLQAHVEVESIEFYR